MHYVARETPGGLGEFPSGGEGYAEKRIFCGADGGQLKQLVARGQSPSAHLNAACRMLGVRGVGLSDRNRTCDPQLRRLLLYPTELRTVVKTKKALTGL